MFKKFNDHEIDSLNTRLIGVYDDWEGFRVIIENVDDNSITRIGFDEVKSYKVTDESYKLNLPNLLNPIGKVIYFTNASDFIAEFHKESLHASRHGHADPKHYNSIIQLQSALQDAVRRVKLHCVVPPPELLKWERLAYQFFPVRH